MFLKYVGVRAPCTRLFDSTQTSAAHTVFCEVKKKKEKNSDGGKKKLQLGTADEGDRTSAINKRVRERE